MGIYVESISINWSVNSLSYGMLSCSGSLKFGLRGPNNERRFEVHLIFIVTNSREEASTFEEELYIKNQFVIRSSKAGESCTKDRSIDSE